MARRRGETGWKRDTKGRGTENFQSSCAFDVGSFDRSVICIMVFNSG